MSEILLFLQEFEVIGVKPLPIMVVILAMQYIKKMNILFFLEYIVKQWLRNYIITGVTLLISAGVSVAFVMSEFSWSAFIETTLLTLVFSHFVYNKFKKFFDGK